MQKIQPSLQHYPNEFGGVFVGYRSPNFGDTIVEVLLIPDNFENGQTEFTRYPESINERLQILHKVSNGQVVYIGEFHSHPNGSIEPSKMDEFAMTKIAQSESFKLDNPILMIGHISSDKLKRAGFYLYNNQKLYKYEQQN